MMRPDASFRRRRLSIALATDLHALRSKQRQPNLPRPARGELIPFACRNDRTFHEDVPVVSEVIRLGNPRIFGEPFKEISDSRQVGRARLVHRVARLSRLQEHVDKRATFKVVAAEPLVEDIEDGEQSLLWGRRSVHDLRFEPVQRPELLAPLQKGQHQVFFGREVTVKRHLRDAGAGDDRVHAHASNALTAEQVVSRSQNALPGLAVFLP